MEFCIWTWNASFIEVFIKLSKRIITYRGLWVVGMFDVVLSPTGLPPAIFLALIIALGPGVFWVEAILPPADTLRFDRTGRSGAKTLVSWALDRERDRARLPVPEIFEALLVKLVSSVIYPFYVILWSNDKKYKIENKNPNVSDNEMIIFCYIKWE